MGVRQRARAKVNLTLKVLGRRGDGYHELESLVTFAAIADFLTFTPGEPAPLVMSGPFADAIEAPNILERALDALRQRAVGLGAGTLGLEKNLPVAAGLGGGSSDAAALLRMARAVHPERAADPLWHDLARRLGADVSVCLGDRPALIRGLGETVYLLPAGSAVCDPLPAVLANPQVQIGSA